MWVQFLGQEDPLEDGMATHFKTLAWRMPWTGESSGLQSIGQQRVRHNWRDLACVHWFQNEKFHLSMWLKTTSESTHRIHTHTHTHTILFMLFSYFNINKFYGFFPCLTMKGWLKKYQFPPKVGSFQWFIQYFSDSHSVNYSYWVHLLYQNLTKKDYRIIS